MRAGDDNLGVRSRPEQCIGLERVIRLGSDQSELALQDDDLYVFVVVCG